MKHVQMRDAKARLSELVAGVEKGEPVTITRHGVDVAVLVSTSEARKLYPAAESKKTLVDYLREIPGPLEIEKDRRPPREIDL
jgi:prevent-host-death family protein